MLTISTLKDFSLSGKKVLLRCDCNVPLKAAKVLDDYRLQKSLPSLQYILEQGASVILLSHLGRPPAQEQGQKELKFQSQFSLAPVSRALSGLLGKPIIQAGGVLDSQTQNMARNLKKGEVICLENIRFHSEETSKNPTVRKAFAKKLAGLADIYVNDAFGNIHREHASTTNITEFIPSAMGLLLEKEIQAFEKILRQPAKPFFVILGGVKFETKIPVLKALLPLADTVLIGGAMAFTFLKAQGKEIGRSILDESYLEVAADFLKQYPKKIVLPCDVVVSKMNYATQRPAQDLLTTSVSAMPPKLEGLDIGPKTIQHYQERLQKAKTVLWNGPLGYIEYAPTAAGTEAMASTLAKLSKTGVFTVVGGGESAAAIRSAGLDKEITHLSTGGGAALEYLKASSLPNKTLPGIRALQDSAALYKQR